MLLSRDVTALEQADAMRRDFVANVSHEIRTPLTVLAGFVETLQHLPLGEEERSRYLGLMARQADRMQTLVSDLLTLSRLEGSPLPGAAEWTPVAELMAQSEQEASALSASLGKSQQLHFAAPPAIEIAGSSRELLSALSNLVSNAVRYTPADGAIEVQWRALADGRGELSVRDSGPGIAGEHLGAADRALLPGRPQPLARDGRHGARAGHRQARAATPWRAAADRQHTGPGLDLRHAVPGEPAAARAQPVAW